jgi:hypothetical protein
MMSPPEELDAQMAANAESWVFEFFGSLLPVARGWFANPALNLVR